MFVLAIMDTAHLQLLKRFCLEAWMVPISFYSFSIYNILTVAL